MALKFRLGRPRDPHYQNLRENSVTVIKSHIVYVKSTLKYMAHEQEECCCPYSASCKDNIIFQTYSRTLTLLLLNRTCPVLANSVDPDQLASSSEAN